MILTQSFVSSFRGHYVVFLCIKIFLHSRSIIFLFVDIRMKIFLQKSIFLKKFELEEQNILDSSAIRVRICL